MLGMATNRVETFLHPEVKAGYNRIPIRTDIGQEGQSINKNIEKHTPRNLQIDIIGLTFWEISSNSSQYI